MSDDFEYAQWDRGNIRGLGKRHRFVRTEKDEQGREVNVYEVIDEEWGDYGQEQSRTQPGQAVIHRWPQPK